MDRLDNANLLSLLAILAGNMAVLVGIQRLGQTDRREEALWSHGLWTANWFLWLLCWIAAFHQQFLLANLLEDLGAFCLIAFAVTSLKGRAQLPSYGGAAALLFILDITWLLVGQTEGNPGRDAGSILLRNTFLHAPSLVLAVFSLGIVAWAFVQQADKEDWLLSYSMAFLTLVYAVFQVPLYQVGLFSNGAVTVSLPAGLKLLFICWRVGLVLFYWVAIWAAAGVRVPFKRVWATLATVLPIVLTLIEMLRPKS